MATFFNGIMTAGRPLNNKNGVTLLETIIYMAIAGLLLAGFAMTFAGQNKSYNRQDAIAEIQQNIRGATQVMASEIRLAGFDPERKGAGFSDASEKSLAFNYWEDDDGNGSFETDRIISYDHYDSYGDGILAIGRKVGAGNNVPLAENIDQLRFEYQYKDKTGTLVWASDADAIALHHDITDDKALDKIQAVKIIILGSVRPSAFSRTDSTIYRPPLEGGGTVFSGEPDAGSGYKRLMSVVVQCRNLRG
ncbi:MAG: prepilin-type N-terminal cleavage/methylation domain-containing protein [Thermodesulfobacteriota bacterium]|nr:prepilin-type N-terminal cleavage/methylation domain-containing protein [Thermodesulfobacteriota bacterium]